MNYIVLDLEMCKVSKAQRRKGYNSSQEIIQIGAVMLDENLTEISSFSTFVRPQYGQIDCFIANLTGIHDSQVRHAPYLREALQSYLGWVNGRENIIYTWSNSDRRQLVRELGLKGTELEGLEDFLAEEHWLDYQKIFGERFKLERNISLKEALDLSDLTLEGRAHDGLEDSRNTGRLIEKMEHNPDYQLPEAYEKARREEKEDALQFSLAGLLAGINLEVRAS